jgi:RHS repeat-associated protein
MYADGGLNNTLSSVNRANLCTNCQNCAYSTFNTHELDQTGLSYFNARYYDSDTGRFISPDPTVPDITKTQSFNRYMFVSGNPISMIDVSGYSEEEGGTQGTTSEVTDDDDDSSNVWDDFCDTVSKGLDWAASDFNRQMREAGDQLSGRDIPSQETQQAQQQAAQDKVAFMGAETNLFGSSSQTLTGSDLIALMGEVEGYSLTPVGYKDSLSNKKVRNALISMAEDAGVEMDDMSVQAIDAIALEAGKAGLAKSALLLAPFFISMADLDPSSSAAARAGKFMTMLNLSGADTPFSSSYETTARGMLAVQRLYAYNSATIAMRAYTYYESEKPNNRDFWMKVYEVYAEAASL